MSQSKGGVGPAKWRGAGGDIGDVLTIVDADKNILPQPAGAAGGHWEPLVAVDGDGNPDVVYAINGDGFYDIVMVWRVP